MELPHPLRIGDGDRAYPSGRDDAGSWLSRRTRTFQRDLFCQRSLKRGHPCLLEAEDGRWIHDPRASGYGRPVMTSISEPHEPALLTAIHCPVEAETIVAKLRSAGNQRLPALCRSSPSMAFADEGLTSGCGQKTSKKLRPLWNHDDAGAGARLLLGTGGSVLGLARSRHCRGASDPTRCKPTRRR